MVSADRSCEFLGDPPLHSAHLLWELSGLVTVDSSMNPFDMHHLAGALSQLPHLRPEHLPAVLHGGFVPQAELEPDGIGELDRFGGGPGGCSPNLPVVAGNS